MQTLVGSVLFGADEFVGAYVASRIPQIREPFTNFAALGVVRSGKFVGGVVYHGYRPDDGDIRVSIAFDDPGWALPGTLRTLFAYPFVDLGCRRMTAIVARSNKRSRRLVLGLGFKLEGVARKAMLGEDAFFYGCLREECKFLRRADDGQKGR